MIGLRSLGGVDEGKEGVAAVAEVTTATEVTLHMDGADSQVAVLRDRISEAGSTLSHSTVGFGEDGEDEGEGAGWVEAEDLEEWIREVSRETSMVEGPYITQWMKLTLRSNSGVSLPTSLSFAFSLVFTHIEFPRRVTAKWAEYPRRSGIILRV